MDDILPQGLNVDITTSYIYNPEYMLNGKSVAVVVPAYNEESQIGMVIDTMPAFVDRIIVVNDVSTDKTEEVVRTKIESDTTVVELFNGKAKTEPNKYNRAEIVAEEILQKESELYVKSELVSLNPTKSRVRLINHLEKGGVGGAIATGYKWCKDHEIDCTAVMAGDGQMDPSELENICAPVVNGEVDYTKANRLSHRSALLVIPKIRFLGNSVLSLLTKIASGYWHVSDTQSGYTAISLKALEAIRIYSIYKYYGCPNDILVKLNIAFCSIKEIPSKPVYNVGEKSKMKELKVVPTISLLLFKLFFRRLYSKYLFRDFHPLFMLYHFAFFLLLIDAIFAFRIIGSFISDVTVSDKSTMAFIFLSISGLQSLFFAMWMDMMDNERLQK